MLPPRTLRPCLSPSGVNTSVPNTLTPQVHIDATPAPDSENVVFRALLLALTGMWIPTLTYGHHQ